MHPHLLLTLTLLTAPSEPNVSEPKDINSATWSRVSLYPNLGYNLTSFAIDRDEQHIWVGTAQGVLFRSKNGGQSWESSEVERKQGEFSAEGNAGDGYSLSIYTPVPFRRRIPWGGYGDNRIYPEIDEAPAALADIPLSTNYGSFTPPAWISHAKQNGIISIKQCSQAKYPLLIATDENIYGSNDDGATLVPLFELRGGAHIRQLACSHRPGTTIAVATNQGLYESKDGGQNFILSTDGFVGHPVTSIAYDDATLWVGYEDELWKRERNANGSYGELTYLEDFGAIDITSISIFPDGDIWLGTTDGAVHYRSRSRRWVGTTKDTRKYLGGEKILGIEPILSSKGQICASLLTPTELHTSCDGGSWQRSYFGGLDNRSWTAILSTGENLWTLSQGDVLTTKSFAKARGADLVDLSPWASEELKKLPTINETVSKVTEGNGFNIAEMKTALERSSSVNWIPRLDVIFDVFTVNYLRYQLQATIFQGWAVSQDAEAQKSPNYALVAVFSWSLPDLVTTPNFMETKKQLGSSMGALDGLTRTLWTEVHDTLQELTTTPMERAVAQEKKEYIRTLMQTLDTLQAYGSES